MYWKRIVGVCMLGSVGIFALGLAGYGIMVDADVRLVAEVLGGVVGFIAWLITGGILIQAKRKKDK